MPHGAKTKVLQDCTKASDKKHNKMQQMAASMRALGSTGCECGCMHGCIGFNRVRMQKQGRAVATVATSTKLRRPSCHCNTATAIATLPLDCDAHAHCTILPLPMLLSSSATGDCDAHAAVFVHTTLYRNPYFVCDPAAISAQGLPS